jgi:predicted N-acetyltransferase YhbS
MQFEPLNSKTHDRAAFDCGVEALNVYVQRFASQDQKRSLSRVYVLADGSTIIGYYSLSSHSVSREHLPLEYKLGGYGDIPFLLLGRLVVDTRFQKQGYGDALIMDAFHRIRQLAEQVGIFGMIVDAKDETASTFYEGFGFIRLSTNQQRLVLPLSVMDELFG